PKTFKGGLLQHALVFRLRHKSAQPTHIETFPLQGSGGIIPPAAGGIFIFIFIFTFTCIK
ncbi:hypothetical protein, partial [Desulfovibrio sp. DV]|uniref:hypothetical protein n=1 Tax=Desulfovibrio sp. DV TaxID=1844708 RepID=UPI001C37AAE1